MDLSAYGLENKVAIVTGGGAGIGKGIALELVKAGAVVAIAEIDSDLLDSTVNEIKTMGGRAYGFAGDMQEPEQVESLMEQTAREFGSIDVLVNNVGGLPGIERKIPFWEMDEELWDRVLRLNTKPLFLCSKTIAKFMIEQKKGGSIINITSIVGLVPPSSLCATYGFVKAGIVNFTTTAATDLGQYGIRVNAIAPGRVETPMTDRLYQDHPWVREPQIKIIPLGRLGKPDDIGKAAVFLASDASEYISGHTILVSGGLTHLYTPKANKVNPEA
ncbi:MAG: hypothetical protein CMI58_03000 [Parcubacteria group bacterium]|jgi:3-oxoacyl-[acyl-carrier protein] reductase|nr:hypothetical protein [Parcubacteria group bacterium]|tara:strand:- start:4151 stop:4972 length:822 start_codon:yes stop_codon:yes gene_type:complete